MATNEIEKLWFGGSNLCQSNLFLRPNEVNVHQNFCPKDILLNVKTQFIMKFKARISQSISQFLQLRYQYHILKRYIHNFDGATFQDLILDSNYCSAFPQSFQFFIRSGIDCFLPFPLTFLDRFCFYFLFRTQPTIFVKKQYGPPFC